MNPPIVIDVTVKLTTPVPELDAEKVPLKVAAKLLLPAIGRVCVTVRVKVPEALITPVPLTKVWKLPKLEPVGVLKLVEPRPVNVIINAFPPPPRKVTELVPLPEQPPQVNVPEVEKVTGSAFACDVPTTKTAIANAPIANAFNSLFMFSAPFFSLVRSLLGLARAHTTGYSDPNRGGSSKLVSSHPWSNAGVKTRLLFLHSPAAQTRRYANQASSKQNHARRFRNLAGADYSSRRAAAIANDVETPRRLKRAGRIRQILN